MSNGPISVARSERSSTLRMRKRFFVRWSDHSAFKGEHSRYLSASKHHWTNYDDDKFDRVFMQLQAAARGTRLHEFAALAIELGQQLRGSNTTVAMYVNHAIGFRMKPEMTLMYSPRAFGTADAISFRKNVLRIHDLKTGSAATSFKQLMCYAALFCLEYDEDPFKIKTVLRIYQNDDFQELVADPDDIKHIMEKYKYFDKRVIQLREEDEL